MIGLAELGPPAGHRGSVAAPRSTIRWLESHNSMEIFELRALGIDFGERRIGLAISDAEGRIAVPHSVVERRTDRQAVYRIAALAREEEVDELVIGEPKGLDGSSGENVDRVHRFGAKLKKATGLAVRFVDEALTTVEAAERLAEAGLDRRDRQELRDAVAAQILLQQALEDMQREPAEPAPGHQSEASP